MHTLKVLCIHAYISLELVLCVNFNIAQLFRYSCFIFPFTSSFFIFQCKLLFPVCFSHLFSDLIILAQGTEQCLHRNWLLTMWKSYQPNKKGRDGDGQIVNASYFRVAPTLNFSVLRSLGEQGKWGSQLRSQALSSADSVAVMGL